MAETPEFPSLEEVVETTKQVINAQWKLMVSFLFGSIDGTKTYTKREVRDRMWVIWSLARMAAHDNSLEEFDAIVREVYERKSEDEPKPQICRSGLPEFKPQAQDT